VDSKTFIESGALEAYVMGLATEQEAKLVMEMAAQYAEVKTELLAIEDAMRVFDGKNAVTPPVELKAKILARIGSSEFRVSGSASSSTVGNAESETQPKVRRLNDAANAAVAKQSPFFKYAAAVALLLLIVSAYYNYSLSNKLDETTKQVAEIQAQNDQLNSTMASADSSVKKMIAEIMLLKTPAMKSVELKGMEVAPEAKAMVYANTQSGEVYLELVNLPPAPDGMQYQFWGIVDGKPVDAGMIPLDGNLSGIHPMKTVTNSTAYAISLEPKGGSQQPQGKIYVLGNV